MKLNIGENIKNLRKERNVTQDELSEILGVSFQSISHWENSDCYPDIELLPTIAGFFGVSVDELIGNDNEIEKKKENEYIERFQNAISKGDIDECINIAREGVAEYPNNEILLNKLMFALFVSTDNTDNNIPNWEENRIKYDSEIVRLGERLAEYAKNTDIRVEAITRLAFHHWEMGRKEKSREIFEKIPRLKNCRESYLWFALEEHEKLPFVREYIYDSYRSLNSAAFLLAAEKIIPDNDAIKVFEKMFMIDDIVFDGERSSGNDLWYFAHSHFELATVYARLGNKDKAIENLNIAAEAAIAFDVRPENWSYSSLLLGEKHGEKREFETTDTNCFRDTMRDKWLADNDFDTIRNSTEFKDIISMLSA
ncbi:MAG: helix-turn-helix transcriptional regulator [Clostridia bacterium]|nr:helix-turn-helix transcriptional regulator [Clostridia bacterium]